MEMTRGRIAYITVNKFEELSKDIEFKNELWTFAEFSSAMFGHILKNMIDNQMPAEEAVNEAFDKYTEEEFNNAIRTIEGEW